MAGFADGAAMVDEEVGELGPFVAWEEVDEVLFDFFRVFVLGEVEALREAGDVCIDDDAYGFVEGVAKDDVGCFAGDAWEFYEFVHCLRDGASEISDDHFGGVMDGFGFVLPKVNTVDEGSDVFEVGVCGCLRCGVSAK